jgi:hypothetical protein
MCSSIHYTIYCCTIGLAWSEMRFAPACNPTGQNSLHFDQYGEQARPNLNLGGVGHGTPPARYLPQRTSDRQLALQVLTFKYPPQWV